MPGTPAHMPGTLANMTGTLTNLTDTPANMKSTPANMAGTPATRAWARTALRTLRANAECAYIGFHLYCFPFCHLLIL